MAITVIQRPQGNVLSTTAETATVTSSSGALFTNTSHGLSTGDYIYIDSDVSSYNGYWYITIADANTFRIYQYATATVQAYVVSTTVTYYKSIYTHGWSCVHLPIVYKLQSDAWPTNGLDTAQTITTFSNYNGYTYIVASGDIKTTGTASALEQVILSGTSVDGVYQIINWFSDTNFVIDLAYSAANVLLSGTVEYYYYNYHAKVRVYGGIKSGHTWQAQKPYELLAEIKAVPDSSGIITVSIEEILKSKISVLNNNTILDTLPNNIDAWCNFYITYAESYDDSNMYTVSEYTSSYTDDSSNFEGYAVNAILHFKSQDSGYLSDYLVTRLFLTAFDEPTLFNGYYYDIGFLNDFNNVTAELKRENYLDSVLSSTSYQAITAYGDGVYRVPVVQHGSEDRIDLTLVSRPTLQALASWTNQSTGTSWTLGANPSLSLSSAFAVSKLLCGTYNTINGITYSINYNLDIAGTIANLNTLDVYILDSSFSPLGNYQIADSLSSTGNYNATITITPNGNGSYIAFYFDVIDLLSSVTVDINSVSASTSITLSETKTININDDCASQNFYLTWLNNLGGFDYWNFTARKTYSVDVTGNSISEKNIYTNWPKSYGAFADTIKQQTSRTSNEVIRVSSQFLTVQQEEAIKQILSSPLVQQVTSKSDRRTVIIDPTTYRIRKDQDDLRTISFDLRYTDDIPSQSL